MEPVGVAIFCDDVREEVGSKISLMGVYGYDMQFQGIAFPVVIPKLGIHVVARLPADRITPPITLLVYLPGQKEQGDEPAMKIDVRLPEDLQREPLPSDLHPEPPHPDLERMHVLRQHIIVSPAILNEAGFVRVRMMYGDQRIKLGALKVHTTIAE